MFNVDFVKILIWIIPVELQMPVLTAYVNCLIIPVRSLYSDFLAKRQLDLYRLSHNSQVCYIRAALNDMFDPEERRITITNGNKFIRDYIYTRAEDRPTFLPTFIRPRSDYADTGVDFYVNVPAELEPITNIYSLKSQIEFYKLATKRYKINFV